MADQPVTKEKLINADIDVENLGKAVNEKGIVNPRYGDSYLTLPSAIQEVIESGGFEPFETEAELLASTPLLTKKASYALDTHKIFLWESGAWKDAGFGVLEMSNKFTIKEISNKLHGKVETESVFYFKNTENKAAQGVSEDIFSATIDVASGEYYGIVTQPLNAANPYFIVDESGLVLETVENLAGDVASDSFIVKIPNNASKLLVNCKTAAKELFSVARLPKILGDAIKNDNQDCWFTDKAPQFKQTVDVSGESVTISFNNNPRIMNRLGQSVKIFPSTATSFVLPTITSFQVLYINKAIESKKFTETPFLSASDIKIGSLLEPLDFSNKTIIAFNQTGTLMNIGACGHKYHDDLIRQIPSLTARVSQLEQGAPTQTVRSAFPPRPCYFNLIAEKCPNFYRKYKDKKEDVVVVLTGTSLTQGNLYTTTRSDATTRPPCLHTNDLASAIFDSLIKHWDGQQYRRYDNADLTYSSGTWAVINQLKDSNDAHVWDDFDYRKNGLTKTTVSASANVSMTIPGDAWQFNFIYRSDKQGGNCTVSIAEGNSKVEAFNGTNWVEANGFVFSMLESAATATKGNTIYQKRLKMRCKNKASGGINSIGSTKQITITKANDVSRFNVVGFEWSPREHMFTLINGARGSHEWGSPQGYQLEHYQDGDIWEFNPDLILAEVTIHNWGASDVAGITRDPLHYVNIAKRAYFNEFNDYPESLFAKSNAYTDCEVVFYSDTLSAGPSLAGAWDSTTKQPKFGVVVSAATNGSTVDTVNVGRVKTNFENYEAVDTYMKSKDYIYIPIAPVFREVTEKYYGTYWHGMQASGANGATLTFDGGHMNDNGAALWASLITPLFNNI